MYLLEYATSVLAPSAANVSGKYPHFKYNSFSTEAGISPQKEEDMSRVFKTLAEQLRAEHSNSVLEEGLNHFPKLPLRSTKTEHITDELEIICALFYKQFSLNIP